VSEPETVNRNTTTDWTSLLPSCDFCTTNLYITLPNLWLGDKMKTQQFAGESGRFSRRYEYDDSWVLAVELGPSVTTVDVDIVGTTAIIIAETSDGTIETEFELPEGETAVTATNGIITITIEQ
jgi:hypothetical protein